MDLITFRCAACNQVLKVSADKAGRKAKCRCGAELTIPLVSEDAARAAAAPAPAARASATFDEEEEAAGTYGLAAEPEPAPEPEKSKQQASSLKAKVTPQDEEEQERKRRRRAELRKAALDVGQWEKVRLGILLVFIATCLGLVGFALQRGVLIVGMFVGPEYAAAADYPYLLPNKTNPVPNEESELDKTTFVTALLAGTENLDLGVWLLRIGQILILLQGLLALAGYAVSLAIPARFGTRGLLIALLCLGGLNLIFQLVFKLLPLAGAMDYTMIPLVAPEIAMTVANVERSVPLAVYWSDGPFWEFLGGLLIQILYCAELVLFSLFLRAASLHIREERMQRLANAVVLIALGTAFNLVAFYLLSITGTSDVVGWVLRAIYSLWVGFYLGEIGWFFVLAQKSRLYIEAKLAEEE